MLYGTLLPAPKIARLCSAQMAAAASDGFECGIHCWDHFKWQDYLFAMRDTEIEAEFSNARAEFEKVFGAEAKCCGARLADFTRRARVEDAANLLYASDVRGEFPFIPKMGGRTFKTIQIPSTLPTLDEVLGTVKIGEVAEMHFASMRAREYSVLTAHAELEGMAYLEWFDKFISEARGRGVEFYPARSPRAGTFRKSGAAARLRNRNVAVPGQERAARRTENPNASSAMKKITTLVLAISAISAAAFADGRTSAKSGQKPIPETPNRSSLSGCCTPLGKGVWKKIRRSRSNTSRRRRKADLRPRRHSSGARTPRAKSSRAT